MSTSIKRRRQPSGITGLNKRFSGSIYSAYLPYGVAGVDVAVGKFNPSTAAGSSFTRGVDDQGRSITFSDVADAGLSSGTGAIYADSAIQICNAQIQFI